MTLEEPDTQSTEESSPQTPTELPPPPLVPVGPVDVEDDTETAEEGGDATSGSEPAPS